MTWIQRRIDKTTVDGVVWMNNYILFLNRCKYVDVSTYDVNTYALIPLLV